MRQPDGKLGSVFDIFRMDLPPKFALNDQFGHIESDAGGGGHFPDLTHKHYTSSPETSIECR